MFDPVSKKTTKEEPFFPYRHRLDSRELLEKHVHLRSQKYLLLMSFPTKGGGHQYQFSNDKVGTDRKEVF